MVKSLSAGMRGHARAVNLGAFSRVCGGLLARTCQTLGESKGKNAWKPRQPEVNSSNIKEKGFSRRRVFLLSSSPPSNVDCVEKDVDA